MVNRETAIQWAKDVGFEDWGRGADFHSDAEEIQALIVRAQNEAFEQAASIANGMMTPKEKPDDYNSWCQGTNEAADRIRAMKQEQS